MVASGTSAVASSWVHDELARRFEEHRPRLRAVAHRLLGSAADADDAVQEAWLRLDRSGADGIENLEAWLVRTVSRIALNLLRSRSTRREDPLEAALTVEGIADPTAVDPAGEVVLADSVGLALQLVLEPLPPPSGWPMCSTTCSPCRSRRSPRSWTVHRSPRASPASRGRRRIRGIDSPTDVDALPDRPANRAVVEAFLAAARDGDFDALLAILDPDIVQRTYDADGSVLEVHGARTVAARAQSFSREGLNVRPALVGGRPGWASYRGDAVYALGALTITDELITDLEVVLDPALIAHTAVVPLGL